MKVKELLSDKSRWTQYCAARSSSRTPVSCHSDSAVCWCLTGAARRCYPDFREREKIYSILYSAIKESGLLTDNLLGHEKAIADFNDRNNSAAVLGLLATLDI
jgi:hypothetical protein